MFINVLIYRLKVTRVHRGVKFVSKAFLKPWIDHCTVQRIEAAKKNDEAEKDFWKLMINSVSKLFISF